MNRRTARVRTLIIATCVSSALLGCGFVKQRQVETLPRVKLVAVLPLDRETPAQTPGGGEAAPSSLPPDAEKVVTAQLYAVLAESPRWRFVSDLSVEQELRQIDSAASAEDRARQLAAAVHADGVFYGSVFRLREREGSEYGSRQPASVAFRLALYSVESGKTIWRGDFSETQQALSSNLLNWWQFWREGPRWFTAAELARLGTEKLIGQAERRVR